jgi:hypothetical protein
MKENKRSDIPMRLEKESNFVDVDFVKGTEIFVMITSENHIFVYENEQLKFSLENMKPEEDNAEGV